MDEHSLANVLMTAKMYPAHAAGLQQVCERSLQQLPTLALKALAPCAVDPAPIRIGRLLRGAVLVPAPSWPPRVAHVTANAILGQSFHRRVAVIPLVADDLLHGQPATNPGPPPATPSRRSASTVSVASSQRSPSELYAIRLPRRHPAAACGTPGVPASCPSWFPPRTRMLPVAGQPHEKTVEIVQIAGDQRPYLLVGLRQKIDSIPVVLLLDIVALEVTESHELRQVPVR